MKQAFDRWLSLGFAAGLCGILSAASVAVAFFGPERSGAFMAHPVLLALTAALAAALAVSGVRAVMRRRFDSALAHLGCACVLAGWLAGRISERASTSESPAAGAAAMIDGDEADKVWSGAYLTNYVGRLPFSVKLEHFSVARYERNESDRDAGRDAPVREYRSRIWVTVPGQAPFATDVRVNHPAKVLGYHIYQMSWGQSTDRDGRPVTYTVLQFIRDPGLSAVYAGFAALFAGVLLFGVRVLRGPAGAKEVPR